MVSDTFEARVRYWFNAPHRTGKLMCGDKHIADVWSDGSITMIEDAASAQPITEPGPAT